MDASLNLEKEKTALVVIDLQKGIAGMPTRPHEPSTVVGNAAKLADAFRKNNMPVFLVHVTMGDKDRLKTIADESFTMPAQLPKDWADIVSELGPKEGDVVVTKKQWGAFYGTELELQLRRRGIDTLVLSGIATNYGVESTARFAYEYGYQQVFAEDAMSSMSPEMHAASVNFVLKRMGRVRSTEQILDALK
jgi:nicotinamidase-related amidase